MKGPGTEGGRVPLARLVELGHHVQRAVVRVAQVLSGQPDSQRPGRKPREIKAACALDVVALNSGSFDLVLEAPPRERQQLLDGGEEVLLGEEAAHALVAGFGALSDEGAALPMGYDAGVLHSVRDIGHVLGEGIDSIEFEAGGGGATEAVRHSYDQAFSDRVVRRIREPITNERIVTGRLLMADFKLSSRKCRVHPPSGRPVDCSFGEDMMDAVQEFLRRNVRVTGEAQIDPETNRIKSIAVSDIEPVTEGDEAFEDVTAEDFWERPNLEDLAREQGVQPVARLEDIFGRGADLWDDDEDFEEFLRTVAQGRKDRETA